MNPCSRFLQYRLDLEAAIAEAVVNDTIHDTNYPLWKGVECVQRFACRTHDAGNTILFIGNGGSAAIASHMAIDFCKAGKLRARAFNDPCALTCLGNDYGYEYIFSSQIECHARPGDLLIAISSSGQSPNILHGVKAARERQCSVVTFSGFAPDNPLRQMGDVNFYVGSKAYGLVEVAHLALLHGILDLMAHVDEDAPARSTAHQTERVVDLVE